MKKEQFEENLQIISKTGHAEYYKTLLMSGGITLLDFYSKATDFLDSFSKMWTAQMAFREEDGGITFKLMQSLHDLNKIMDQCLAVGQIPTVRNQLHSFFQKYYNDTAIIDKLQKIADSSKEESEMSEEDKIIEALGKIEDAKKSLIEVMTLFMEYNKKLEKK